MKKILYATSLLVVLAGCKKTEEVKIDETPVEKSGDSISKDTLVSKETAVVEDKMVAEDPATVTEDKKQEIKSSYASFGAKISDKAALNRDMMYKKYKSLKKGDTIQVKFTSKIHSVCKKKGCWMKMDLADKQEAFVRFKDYGFFVPLNADGSEAVVSGRAYLDVISVEELRHYAKDGGKSEEEIAKITEPKVTYAFQADGVLIKE